MSGRVGGEVRGLGAALPARPERGQRGHEAGLVLVKRQGRLRWLTRPCTLPGPASALPQSWAQRRPPRRHPPFFVRRTVSTECFLKSALSAVLRRSRPFHN